MNDICSISEAALPALVLVAWLVGVAACFFAEAGVSRAALWVAALLAAAIVVDTNRRWPRLEPTGRAMAALVVAGLLGMLARGFLRPRPRPAKCKVENMDSFNL